MTIEDFKQEIDVMFPCRWKNDFIQDVRETFDKYINIVSCIDGISGDALVDLNLPYMLSSNYFSQTRSVVYS